MAYLASPSPPPSTAAVSGPTVPNRNIAPYWPVRLVLSHLTSADDEDDMAYRGFRKLSKTPRKMLHVDCTLRKKRPMKLSRLLRNKTGYDIRKKKRSVK